jgi:hypothetical protein
VQHVSVHETLDAISGNDLCAKFAAVHARMGNCCGAVLETILETSDEAEAAQAISDAHNRLYEVLARTSLEN